MTTLPFAQLSGSETALLSASGVLTALSITVALATLTLALLVHWQLQRLRRSNGGERAGQPVRGLSVVLLASVLLLAGAVAASTRPRSHLREDAEALTSFRGEALMLDERLTMSARLAAASGDLLWEARYREAERDLDATLARSDELLTHLLGGQAKVARESIEKTGVWNQALIALENRCFDRVRASDRRAAMDAVMSDEYERLKVQYKSAVMDSDIAIAGLVNASIERNELWAVVAGVLGMASAGVMVAGTLLLSLALARHSRALAQRNQELVTARTRADVANQSKSEFLATMSHEIRTPVTAILGFADLLSDASADAQRADNVETIRRAGRHLLAVINDILDLSKIEAGRMTMERIETDLPRTLVDLISLLRPRAAAKTLRLEIELATPIPMSVYSDPTRLRQILMNVAGNAIKFTDTGSVTLRIRVAPTAHGEQLFVDVVDTGAGITPEAATLLFRPFAQADTTVARRYGGSGLGLTISRQLSRLMGGDLALLHSAPGTGSHFRISLPLDVVSGSGQAESLLDVPSAVPQRDTPRRLIGRILLAEDGADNRRLIQFHLQRAGAEVATAEDGRQALEMIEAAQHDGTPFDVLLTDMQMPELDGYALTRKLREQGSIMPIIALTANAMAEDRQRCVEAGCDDYLSKPIDRAALLSCCERWLDRAVRLRAA